MAQASTESHPAAQVTFLTLPYPVRRHIYNLVGLVRSCPIDLNYEVVRKDHILSGARS